MLYYYRNQTHISGLHYCVLMLLISVDACIGETLFSYIFYNFLVQSSTL